MVNHGFMKIKSHLGNMIFFYDKVTCLEDEEKAADIIFPEFSKTFDSVPHGILPVKLSSCEINRFMICWVANWFNGRA